MKMNVQAHMSVQVSNQTGNQLPGAPQQNRNSFHNLVQNLGGQGNPSVMDTEFVRLRRFMRDKIYEMLSMRQPPSTELDSRKLQDISRRLEEGLFKTATTKEEYINMDTLQSRLQAFLKRPVQTSHAPQRSQFLNSSTSVGAMIPTPGMQHNENLSVIVSSAVDLSAITANTGGIMPSSPQGTGTLLQGVNGSFSSMRGGPSFTAEGSLSNGYQQSPSSFSMNSAGNNMVAGQRPISQMIPTPGFSSNSNNTLMNVDIQTSNGVFSNGDSSVVQQQVPQRQVGGQNTRMLQNLGGGMRSLMQRRFQNGSVNSGFGSNGQVANGLVSSDGCQTTSSFVPSSRPLLQPHDTHQRPVMRGDLSGTGNFYSTGAPVGSLMNKQNVNQVRTPSLRRPNSLATSYMRPQLAEQVERLSFQSSQPARENYSQSSPRQLQQQPLQMPQHQHSGAYHQPQQSSEQYQGSVRSGTFNQLHIASRLGSHMKHENGRQSELIQSQGASRQLQVPELRNQFLYNSNGILITNSQVSSLPSGPQDSDQKPQPMMVGETTNDYSSQPFGAQSEGLLNSHWHSDTERTAPAGKISIDQPFQEEFRQRILVQDEAQSNNLSGDGCSMGQAGVLGTTVGQPRLGDTGGSVDSNRDRKFKDQRRWLLFLHHARYCKSAEGKCQERTCSSVQKLWRHMDDCKAVPCSYPRCHQTRMLLRHRKICKDLKCPVCVPVKNFIRAQVKAYTRLGSIGLQRPLNEFHRSAEAGDAKPKEMTNPPEVIVESLDSEPSMKRLKSELPSRSASSETESLFVPLKANAASHVLQFVQSQEPYKKDNSLQVKPDFPDVRTEMSVGSNHSGIEIKNMAADAASSQRLDAISTLNEEITEVEKDKSQMKPEVVAPPPEQGTETKCGKPKIKGVSLTEKFTPEQVREHITGLRQWVGQSKAKAEKNQAMEASMSENSCQLCAVERLTFEPPPMYCSPCGARIKRNAMFYTVGAGDTRHYFCIRCYNEVRGDTIAVDGANIPKSRMEKKKNDEDTEEWWVQCDKCEAWQHQICALFNAKRNDGGQAEYTCPNCYVQEVEKGERKPLPESAVLGAKDLPRTILSDHIEQRLAKRLKQERLERARKEGKSFEEVPGVEGVVVRVVSSVDKKLEVKPRLLEIFREENYPSEFPYKSKVVLLFQKIEGVEVCLFGMYVQEFGSECLPANQRRVYLSYLDSVKYFRPEVKAVTGEALRTFVYHEILIGYLDYCKLRGFASCYIWACPPLKGEDYILYCHPEIQKTPKSDKLREWYLAMLRKATRENIVVELTNLYDHFFLQTGESKAKVTAARLPYFDGDYWPGAAEDMIYQINQEEEGRKLNKKGPMKKTITKRALKASGQSDLSSNVSKDLLLMHKLGETIAPMKEDFIMVHLQYACTHCCLLMVSGNRWVCELCKNFQLCDRCHDAEERRDDRERHPINQKYKHGLKKIEITDIPDDTKDKDEILESEFFDTRQAFLSLCQGNHYQNDTLRRAKHSSMMVLYHLHNPTAPAFLATCNSCHLDIETGQGWRCETCPDYDVCNACYQKDGDIDHPHKLTNHPSIADCDAQNKEARQKRVTQLRKMLDLLVHASHCRSPHCQYPDCRKVKGLFHHGLHCRIRAPGGCVYCIKMWYLLRIHARTCKETKCHVPRCRDLNEHLRRLQQQSDSRRRAAVLEMMRQRASEVSGNSS